MSKERVELPDSGTSHAVMDSLIEGKWVGFITTKEEIKRSIALEHGDKRVNISDSNVEVTVSRVRKIFYEYDYEVFCENGVGYELVGLDEIDKKRSRILPNNGPKHDALIALFNAKKAGSEAPKEYLRDAMLEGFNEKHHTNIQFYTDLQFDKTLGDLRRDLRGTGSGYRIICRRNIGYEILSPEELANNQ